MSDGWRQSSGDPPRDLRRTICRRLCLAGLLLAIVALGLLFPFPVYGRLWGSLFDMAHAPAFFAVLLAFTAFFDPALIGLPGNHRALCPVSLNRVATLATALAVLGLLGEYLQQFVGRNPSLKDVAANSAGLAAGVCWVAAFPTKRSVRKAWLVAAVLIMAAASWAPARGVWDAAQQIRRFPVLASFEDAGETRHWLQKRATLDTISHWAAMGDYSGRVQLKAARFSGVTLPWLVDDWSEYHALKLVLHNPDSQALTLTLKICDYQHIENDSADGDRFERGITVGPRQTEEIAVLMSELRSAPARRIMQLEKMGMLEIFAVDSEDGQVFYMDHLRLVK